MRQSVRALAVVAKLSLVDQTKLVTAASELARNTLVYGGGGSAVVELVTTGRRRGVRAAFADQGPGITDVALALTDGWTSGTGLGLGLSGAKRLVDDFDLETGPGEGTVVKDRQVDPMTGLTTAPHRALAEDVTWIRVEDASSPGALRRRAVELAERVGLDEKRAGEVAIVVTELATNLAKYAQQGVMLLRLLRRDSLGGVEMVAVDRGPGHA